MDDGLRKRMLDYYNERAAEYEEAYTKGTGTASIKDPDIFVAESKALFQIVADFAHGSLIDIACGTGYWFPHYQSRCSRIDFIDQSENMLSECKAKAEALGVESKCRFVRGDVFEHPFEAGTYDCALIGFFVSHTTKDQESHLFRNLKRTLKESGRFLVVDSAWSEERAKANAKEEDQQRFLNDGTPFHIYKRYLDRQDVFSWEVEYLVRLSLDYFGPAFLAVSGTFA